MQTLRIGIKNDDVKKLQEALNKHGFNLSVDGDFGPKTEKAIKEFQTKNELKPDGIVGPKTWEVLLKNQNTDFAINPLLLLHQVSIQTYSLKMSGNTNITPNFKVKEFACKDGSDKILIDVNLVIDRLQKIREHFEKPVTVVSAYRTEAYNQKVGGASNSFHIKGQAFDISINGITPLKIAQYAEILGINGIIQYNNFTHIDSRPTKYWARNNNGAVSTRNTFKFG